MRQRRQTTRIFLILNSAEEDGPYTDGLPTAAGTWYIKAVAEARLVVSDEGKFYVTAEEIFVIEISPIQLVVDSIEVTKTAEGFSANYISISGIVENDAAEVIPAVEPLTDGRVKVTYSLSGVDAGNYIVPAPSYVTITTDLNQSIADIQNDLKDAVAELEAAIGSNGGDIAAINEKLTALENAYKAADTLIETDISALKSADEAIKEQFSSLQTTVEDAKAALQTSIDTVQANLDAAVKKLEEAIAAGDDAGTAALEKAISDLTTAYQNADALIRTDFAEADANLKTELEKAIKDAETTLGEALEAVEAQLDAAVEELQAAIDANAADTAPKLAALEEAYKAADALLDADIAALQGETGQLEEALADLEAAYKAADEALWQAVEQLQGTVDTHTALLWVLAAAVVVALGVGAAGLVLALKRRG